MIVLDTNVVSALMNDPPEPRVVAWLDAQVQGSIWTTSITVLEIETGLRLMAAGKKQSKLAEVFAHFLSRIDHRVATFDEEAARQAASLTALRRKRGQIQELRDTMIAGIVLARRSSLATRNIPHFRDIDADVINPWQVKS